MATNAYIFKTVGMPFTRFNVGHESTCIVPLERTKKNKPSITPNPGRPQLHALSHACYGALAVTGPHGATPPHGREAKRRVIRVAATCGVAIE